MGKQDIGGKPFGKKEKTAQKTEKVVRGKRAEWTEFCRKKGGGTTAGAKENLLDL